MVCLEVLLQFLQKKWFVLIYHDHELKTEIANFFDKQIVMCFLDSETHANYSILPLPAKPIKKSLIINNFIYKFVEMICFI